MALVEWVSAAVTEFSSPDLCHTRAITYFLATKNYSVCVRFFSVKQTLLYLFQLFEKSAKQVRPTPWLDNNGCYFKKDVGLDFFFLLYFYFSLL